jgi:hypothetical protein
VSAVNLDAVGRTMQVLLRRIGRALVYNDPADGSRHVIEPETVAAPDGFLPVVLVAGEAVWREATGKGFALDIPRDSQALLGYRLRRIGAGTFATVMLASLEAIHQVARNDTIVINDLHALWSAATERLRRNPVMPARWSLGPRP